MTIKGLMFVRKLKTHSILCAVVKNDSIPNLKNEHQHLLIGLDEGDSVHLKVDCNRCIDIKEKVKGSSIDGILTSPIWRN